MVVSAGLKYCRHNQPQVQLPGGMKVSTQRRSPRAQQTSMPLTWTMTGYSLNYRLLTDSNMSVCEQSSSHIKVCGGINTVYVTHPTPKKYYKTLHKGHEGLDDLFLFPNSEKLKLLHLDLTLSETWFWIQ